MGLCVDNWERSTQTMKSRTLPSVTLAIPLLTVLEELRNSFLQQGEDLDSLLGLGLGLVQRADLMNHQYRRANHRTCLRSTEFERIFPKRGSGPKWNLGT